MAANGVDKFKGTSPSKNIQRGVDTAWNPKSTTDPKQALKDKHTNSPVPVPGKK